ncbi:MAG: hypothetical protein WAQ98_27705 [Blastocatellia bacterium]
MDLKDMLDKEYETKSPKELVDAPVSALQGISEEGGKALEKALRVKTIGDLAKCKYFQWAQDIKKLAEG